ncbi:MAG: DNA polymerase I [Thiotrichaceae bacterium]|nr:DNA polymerase I [Thiotrichaceae bacterium]
MTANNTLFLVDGSSYLYRAYHAMPNLLNAQGKPTGVAYGVTNMLKRLLQEYQPQHAAIVFDAKGKTFRHELYPEYKATRSATPDELIQQIAVSHDLVRALGFPLLMETGVEADDVIGTLAKQAEALGMQVVIFTGDKDFAQLVNENIILINTMNNTRLDIAGVEEKFGVPPQAIIDYLILVGDSSDNIPGVDKVGAKTASKWLRRYGSLENLLNNSHSVVGKVGENLRAAVSQFPLARELVTIRCDVPLPLNVSQLQMQAPETERLRALFADLGFKQWLKELGGEIAPALPIAPLAPEPASEEITEVIAMTPEKLPQAEFTPQIILNEAEFDKFLAQLQACEVFTLDIKTNTAVYLEARCVALCFALPTLESFYLPLAHDYLGVPPQLDKNKVLAALKPVLEADTPQKQGHHLKVARHVLANEGIQLRGINFDSEIAAYVLNSTHAHQREALSIEYLERQLPDFSEVAGKGSKQLAFSQLSIEKAAEFCLREVQMLYALYAPLHAELMATPSLEKVFAEIDLPLLWVLAEMERRGIMLDVDKLAHHSQELGLRLQQLEREVYAMAGVEFNLNSPKQLQSVLFEKMGLPILEKTSTGQASTAESVLQELANDYPLPALILEYRSLSKLKSTYTDALPALINPKTGRLHTTYNQTVTVTGRLSSTEPNLQNIPIRSAEGRRIRQAFIAPPGSVLLAADYSQIELRIMAHLSGDAGLLAAFAAGEDIHRATAADVFGLPLNEVSTDQRRSAKAINFGLIYGMSAFGLAKQLNVTRSVAQSYIEAYFTRYPAVKTYMENTQLQAREQGYVETVFGRRLYIPEISARNAQRRQYAERTAINAPMQGTAADIIKLAMIAVHNWLSSENLEIQMLLQVHDELVFELPEHLVEMAQPKIISLMSAAANLRVPLVVDVGVGKNWDEAH